ncbi:MAG: hypothetical protein J6P97_05115 [Bacteroidales bacterium]|nr:hypothetical protein [Bacteroidales bacterium]
MIIKPPVITAPTTEGKLKQIEDYLFMLSRDLQIAFEEINEKNIKEGSSSEVRSD